MEDAINKRLANQEEQAKDILSLDGLKEKVLELREYLGIPSEGFQNSDDISAWNRNISAEKNNYYNRIIDEILEDYSLGAHWREALKSYILTNQMVGGWILPRVSSKLDGASGQYTEVSIIIHKDTTLGDIETIWSEVEEIQKDMKGRFNKRYKPKKPENRERDNEIMKRYLSDGLSVKEISHEFCIGYLEVQKIIKREKKRRDMS